MKAFRFIFIKSVILGMPCVFAAILLFAVSMQGFCQEADRAVTYQITTEHNGCITTSPELQPPLTKKWSIDFGATVSYPLIAEGNVFVTVSNTGSYGTKLYAIDADTGEISWGPVEIAGTYHWSGSAYGDGCIYVVNFDGLMRAFSASDGQELWNINLPSQRAFTSPPTFKNGIVYTGGAGIGGTLYAVNAATGTLIWMQSVVNGDHSSPAVTIEGVYVTYAGGVTHKFDPIGNSIWVHTTGASGGGGKTPVIYDGRLYSRDHYPTWAGFVLDASTGAYKGGYDTQATPAFYNGSGYVIYNGNLQRMVTSNLAVMWTSTLTGLVTPPIIVNGVVYVGSSDGYLFAVDPGSGLPFWSDNVGSTIAAPDEHNAVILAAMGAGEGIIVVPASNLLVAYGGASGNDSPVVTCTPPAEVECASPDGTQYTVNAEVSDANGDPLTVEWYVDGAIVQTDTTSGGDTGTTNLTMTYIYPLGMHDISVEVSDGNNPTVFASTSVNVVDTTVPEVSVSVGETTLNTSNRKMVDVGFSASIMDIVDTNPAFSIAVYSDEDDICGTAGPDMSPDAMWSPNLMLRMECNPQGDGRVYLVVVTAIDESGNKSFGCTAVTVPKSNSPKAVSSVKTQAQEAMDWCLTNGGTAPAGYFVVGDGPEIGKK